MEIRNKGYIDPIKHSNDINIMTLNVKGLDLQKCKNGKIDRVYKSSLNR